MHESIQDFVSRPKYINRYTLFFVLAFVVLFILREQKNIAAIFLFVFFIFILLFVFFKSRRFEDTENWDKIKATILNKRILKMNCWTMFRRATLKQNTYALKIKYQYHYHGKEYASDRYALSYNDDADCNYMYSLEEAREILKSLETNGEIDIFVNPADPSESVIKQGRSEKYGLPFGQLSVLFLTYFVYLFLVLSQSWEIWNQK